MEPFGEFLALFPVRVEAGQSGVHRERTAALTPS
jgi:hypothetical protein